MAFRVLGKYASNLLKHESERHHSWRKVTFLSSAFQQYVRPLTGNIRILNQIGYCDEVRNETGDVTAVLFRDGEVNSRLVTQVATDLCIAKVELEEILSGSHPHLESLKAFSRIPRVYYTQSEGNQLKPDSVKPIEQQLQQQDWQQQFPPNERHHESQEQPQFPLQKQHHQQQQFHQHQFPSYERQQEFPQQRQFPLEQQQPVAVDERETYLYNAASNKFKSHHQQNTVPDEKPPPQRLLRDLPNAVFNQSGRVDEVPDDKPVQQCKFFVLCK